MTGWRTVVCAALGLLISVTLTHDLGLAAESDHLENTIDYFQVAQLLLDFGREKSLKLIEKVAHDVANAILSRYGPKSVFVEVKKFIIPQAAYVSVTCEKPTFELPSFGKHIFITPN